MSLMHLQQIFQVVTLNNIHDISFGIFLCEKILFHMGYLPLKHISCLKGFIMFDRFLIRVPTVVFHT
jgi:hypothetical protein